MRDRVRDDGLLAQILALELSGDPSLAHDEHAIGDRRISGSSEETTIDRLALGGEPLDQAVDFGLRADVDAARRLVEQQDLAIRRDPAADDRLLLVAAARKGGSAGRSGAAAG